MKIKAMVLICLMLGFAVTGLMVTNTNNILKKTPDEEIKIDTGWHEVFVWTPTGEATPSGGNGVVSVFLLNFSADAGLLANNNTDWSADGNVHAYADSDGFSEDTPSETAFVIVVRCRFTKAVCYDGSDNQFVGNRTKCTITFSGDASGTISHYGNHTESATGGGICSENNSANASLWVNFYFTDADGYELNDDGSLTISSIVVAAKY